MADIQDDEYEIPLRDQRYFGAGIKRKRVQFVPSSIANAQQSTSLPSTPSTSAADRYLSIVLKKPNTATSASTPPEESILNPTTDPEHVGVGAVAIDTRDAPEADSARTARCDICHRPLSAPDSIRHESSIAHQICLAHSHPPSHIDRTRKGLAVLESHGWDADSRLGLGAQGSEGRLYPVRATENPSRVGLGAKFEKVKEKEKSAKLDAGKVRLIEKEGKKKAEALRNAFYRNEEVEKYLGQEQTHTGLDLQAFRRAKRGR